MTIKKINLVALLLTSFTTNAQLQQGKKNIDKMCGCFTVDFKYAETFSPDTTYKFHDREHQKGIELVLPIERTDTKIILQHLLVVNDTTVIKHWREDWIYEQLSLLQYNGDKQWTKQILAAKDVQNKWVQTVWEVDDAPRYQGISEWITVDSKALWQNTTNAPLPRREYTKRNDYNILKRGNKIIVTDNAWWHEQDNQKINKSATEKLIVEEKGMNYYAKTDNSKCEKAKQWWKANSSFWNIVRIEWDNYFKTHNSINLKAKVDDKRLDEYFTDLWKQWSSKRITAEVLSTKVKVLVAQFTEVKNIAVNN